MGIEGSYLNIIKTIYDKPTATIILNGEKLKEFLFRSGTRQGCLLEHSFGSPSHGNQRRKGNKWNPNWKGRSKTITNCRWLDIFCNPQNPKDATNNLFDLINQFGKVAENNTQKSTTFLYPNMKDQKEKLGKQSPLPLHQKE